LAEVTMKMHEDIIKTTIEITNLKLLSDIYLQKESGKSSEEILDWLKTELKK
jgi:hypothetical protein